ncbi:MAG: MoaD/ThiS family protein [Chloroflexi bacterium]|nr:MoaD/ThiS family protein [Chloroflexota bacterium]
MKVKLRLFALYRELLGKSQIILDLPPNSDAAALKQIVERDYPRLQGQDPVIAVNGVYASPDQKLAEGDEVALLPPFSGGQPCLECHSEERSNEESGEGPSWCK